MQLAGELTKISLPSLIQLIRNGELTGKVCLTRGANTAFIHVKNGRIIHVESDAGEGRIALLELFLWQAGSFSFMEADVDNIQPSLPLDEPVEKIIRLGLSYLEKKLYLDRLRVNSRAVLQGIVSQPVDNALFVHLNGQKSLGQLNDELKLERFDFVESVYDLLTKGYAVVVDPPATDNAIDLPDWVLSRLRQDNSDISQAIIEMVIWVDRVKCWMYQADAELDAVVDQLSNRASAAGAGVVAAPLVPPVASAGEN